MPPNFVFTGPISKASGDLLESLKEKDAELFEWLE
jgi:hypothetical protein